MAKLSTELKLPTLGTVIESIGLGWGNPSNIQLDDGLSASNISFSENQTSQLLLGRTYGFSIPTIAEIVGIEVEIKASVGSSTLTNIALTKNSTTRVGTVVDGTFPQGGDQTTITYGSSSDLWGTTWTPAQINASTFGVTFRDFNTVGRCSCYVDYIKVKIHYTAPNKAIRLRGKIKIRGKVQIR